MGEKLQVPSDFNGGVAKRRCTDVVFLLLIVIMWMSMTFFGIDAIQNGNPHKILNGVDTEGRICGIDDGVKDLPKFYFVNHLGSGACVAECPSETNWNNLYTCFDSEPGGVNHGLVNGGIDCGDNGENPTCLSKAGLTSTYPSFSGEGGGVCMYQIQSFDFLNYCIYIDGDIYAFFSKTIEQYSFLQEFLSDIWEARVYILLFGLGIALVAGFLYSMLLTCPCVVFLLTWGGIAGTIALFAAIGYAMLYTAEGWEQENEENNDELRPMYQINAAKAFGYMGYIFSALFLCLALFMRKRISLANGIIKEAARVIKRMPTLVVMPILSVIGIAVFLIPWFTYSVYTASLTTVSTYQLGGLSLKEFEYEDEIIYRGWFLLFCAFWSLEYISAMVQIVLALCIVKYYFSRDKSKDIGSCTVFKQLFSGIYYHSGTAALGGLIIAIVRVIRAVIAYFQKQAKKSGSKVAQACLCCMQCCFWCLEKCMRFINKNAYIQTAIFSTSFCVSAKAAFWLIARNLLRVGAVSLITYYILIIMKLVISLGVAVLAYLGMKHMIEDKLFSIVGPTILVAIFAYFVAGIFANLYSMTTSTLLQCFIADEEMFEGDKRYAENDLKKWIGTHGSTTCPTFPKGKVSP